MIEHLKDDLDDLVWIIYGWIKGGFRSSSGDTKVTKERITDPILKNLKSNERRIKTPGAKGPVRRINTLGFIITKRHSHNSVRGTNLTVYSLSFNISFLSYSHNTRREGHTFLSTDHCGNGAG